jgi:mycothiol synthase
MTDRPSITCTSTLTTDDTALVEALVTAASLRDGFSALNEAALLHLRHPRPEVSHLLARTDRLVGYAQLDQTSGSGGPASVGQLVVHPDHREVGVGAYLLAELLRLSGSRLQIWAMGNRPAAQALAGRAGLVVGRELLVMTRSLADPVPLAPLPAGVTVRTFVVGQDEQAWLGVNARAFAEHPEQGQLTRDDLEERLAEPWFDAQGFFLAERDSALVGFHWTKQHAGQLGEVYVLGVDPHAGGAGLGKALLSRGLTHLRERGLSTVELYVEADHERAVNLYTRYGFAVSSRDVMYVEP